MNHPTHLDTQTPASPTTADYVPPTAGSPSFLATIERALMARLLQAIGRPALRIVLPGGQAVAPMDGRAPVATVRIRDHRTLWKLVIDPSLEFGDAYTDGRLEVEEGSLLAAIRAVDAALMRSAAPDPSYLGWRSRLPRRRNTLRRARRNIRHHYDLGNDFYKLWLDDQLVYTCAYFRDPQATLEQAQIDKMDHVCRKVLLQPGESVIEAGCGWGALALHMARCYGVRVRAYNISHEQIIYARDRARAEGLDDRVEFIEDDWRNITGTCDAFISVGMLEHVGVENYEQLGALVARCLPPNGRGLIHSIGLNRPRRVNAWTERRIFPGGQPPALSQMMRIFEPHNLAVLDVENLRLHYARTLTHWLARFEEAADLVADMFDERFVRMWRLYLTASIATFESGLMHLFQVLFAPAANNAIPATREYQYRPHPLVRACWDSPPV